MVIIRRIDGSVIREVEGADLRGVNLRGADLRGADLYGDNLSGAFLHRADLCGANLYGADLSGADLYGANLYGADLRKADFYRADLYRADLSDIAVSWQSHHLLAELLRRAAGDSIPRRMVAGLLLVSPDMCWCDFLAINHPEKQWALDMLRAYSNERSPMPTF